MTDNILTTKQTVTLSIGYPKWYADKHKCSVDYAATYGYGQFQVERRNADNTYTLRRGGLVLDSVPRHLLIVERK